MSEQECVCAQQIYAYAHCTVFEVCVREHTRSA